MSKLECKDFTVQYFGYDAAISGVSTSFSDGINVIYAAEKGGKTTFLKALSGLIEHKGELLLDGENIDDVTLKDRDFQMLFDDYALFTRRSVRYNLEYLLSIRKIPKAERKQRIEEILRLFDLDLMIDAPVYRLNEWLKVALVLCRAYLRNAKVLLIDNIFSKLDYQSRKEAFRRFMPLFQGQGIVIYATDSTEEAEALSSDIKFLSYGYLMQEGSGEDFRRAPRSVSAFLSFSDYAGVLSCTASENGLLFGDYLLPWEGTSVNEVYFGKEVLAGISSSDLVLSESGLAVRIQGRFLSCGKPLYTARYGEDDLWFFSDRELSIGEKVHLVPMRTTGLFDPVNQRSILRY